VAAQPPPPRDEDDNDEKYIMHDDRGKPQEACGTSTTGTVTCIIRLEEVYCKQWCRCCVVVDVVIGAFLLLLLLLLLCITTHDDPQLPRPPVLLLQILSVVHILLLEFLLVDMKTKILVSIPTLLRTETKCAFRNWTTQYVAVYYHQLRSGSVNVAVEYFLFCAIVVDCR
jgi:hypothetical protein